MDEGYRGEGRHKPVAVRSRHAALRRPENMAKNCRKDWTRANFHKDPFKFVKGVVTKEKSGSLSVSKADLEKHRVMSCTDNRRHRDHPPTPPVQPQEHTNPMERSGEICVQGLISSRAHGAPFRLDTNLNGNIRKRESRRLYNLSTSLNLGHGGDH